MSAAYEIMLLTLMGLSLLFVGGFVLWSYRTPMSHSASEITGPEAEATRAFHVHLVHWVLLYGAVAIFVGIVLMLTAIIMLL